MYQNVVDLYFEVEQQLGLNNKNEIEAISEIIQKLGDKKDRERSPLAQDALGVLLERAKKVRGRMVQKLKTLDEAEEAQYRFMLKLIKDKLGKELEIAIDVRKTVQFEEVAKKYLQKFVEEKKPEDII